MSAMIRTLAGHAAHTALFVICLSLTPADALSAESTSSSSVARGLVFHDSDADGIHDPNEPGITGVRVSNGRDIVATDAGGRYEIRLNGDAVLFVLKPRDWMPPLDDNNLSRFYYIHRPRGSPKHLRFAGPDPTGALPNSVDFPLYKRPEPERFSVVVWADPQVGNSRSLGLMQCQVVPELVGTDAAFGITLGDIVWNDLSFFEPVNSIVKHIGIPWYNVIGNHDLNFDHVSPETFIKHYGPRWYAFDHGPVHFIVLDNTHATGSTKRPRYEYRFGAEQLEFVRNDLRAVPSDQLVVLLMHAALTATLKASKEETRELFSLFAGREHVLAFAGHNHRNLYHWFDRKRHWPNDEPLYQRVVGAISGHWWKDERDDCHIPTATMRDGTPRGYFLLSFDGPHWSYRFKATRRPADDQMRIHVPDVVPGDQVKDTAVLVNVYAGNDRTVTEMRVDAGTWIRMKRVRRPDPYYKTLVELREQSSDPARKDTRKSKLLNSTHLWQAHLPADLATGSHLLQIRSMDMFGFVARATTVVRVTASDEKH